jgi:hypothetical protein
MREICRWRRVAVIPDNRLTGMEFVACNRSQAALPPYRFVGGRKNLAAAGCIGLRIDSSAGAL